METGLGGLLDATNTISGQDKVAVLTTIGLDHTEVLGPTSWSMKEECAAIPKRYRRLDQVLIKSQLGRVIVVNHTPPALVVEVANGLTTFKWVDLNRRDTENMARIRTEVELDEAVLRQAQTAAESSGRSRDDVIRSRID